jgi:shikimate dehydrogenase
LIIGSGGAAQAVSFILKKLGIRFKILSRKPKAPDLIPYSALTEDIIGNHLMIINCTPLGMYPNIESKPDIPYQFISKHHVCYDLVYLPEKTAFLNACKDRNAITKNGLEMLQLQAEKSLEIWLSNEF